MLIYFSFSNYYIYVSFQFVDLECFVEELKLFLMNGVVDIENNFRVKSRYVEFVNFLLVENRIMSFEKMS